jgi:hypothetical protein
MIIFLLSTILMLYVARFYYIYFTRVNPLPGPFPFPFVGNLPQIFCKFNGNAVMFYRYCYKEYGDIHEIYAGVRTIVLCRPEYLESFLSKTAFGIRFKNCKELKELGIEERGISLNNNFKSWLFNRHFFNQAILSPKFTDEVIDWTNELFNELEGYWDKLFLKEEIIKENKNKFDFTKWFDHYANDMVIKLLTGTRSYSTASYFDTLNDEKTDLPSVIVEDSMKFVKALHKLTGYSIFFIIPSFLRNYVPFLKNMADDILQNLQFVEQRLYAIIKRRRQKIDVTPLDKPLPHDMLTSMIIKNSFRDVNYIETGEADRTMTDVEICANLREGILGGTLKVSFFREILFYNFNHRNLTKCFLFFFLLFRI